MCTVIDWIGAAHHHLKRGCCAYEACAHLELLEDVHPLHHPRLLVRSHLAGLQHFCEPGKLLRNSCGIALTLHLLYVSHLRLGAGGGVLHIAPFGQLLLHKLVKASEVARPTVGLAVFTRLCREVLDGRVAFHACVIADLLAAVRSAVHIADDHA